jgi:hypothetical protein
MNLNFVYSKMGDLTSEKMSSGSPKRSAKGGGSKVVTTSSNLGGGMYLLHYPMIQFSSQHPMATWYEF